MRTFLIFLSFMIALPLFSQTTIHVPFDYPTIQGGLNAAGARDTVLVAPGIYYENIVWPSIQGLKLISLGTRENTIIDGDGTDDVIYMVNRDSETLINGFTLRNGTVGIQISSSSPLIYDVIITNNSNNGNGGGVLINGSPTSPVLNNVIITNNRASRGGGILCAGDELTNLTLTNSSILRNSADINGGGLYCSRNSAILTNVIISDNNAGQLGGGIFCWLNAQITLEAISISNNSAGLNGGGISLQVGAIANISETTISGNQANEKGGGLFSDSENFGNIDSVTFIDNFSPLGDGIYADVSLLATINSCNFINHNNAIYNNIVTEFIDARYNYFGHSSGPYHPTQNPAGLGDSVNLYVRISPWLTEPNIDAPPIPALNVKIFSTTQNSILLSWDKSEMVDIAGYKVHYGIDSTTFEFPNTIDVGLDTTYTLSSLVSGSTYYFSVTTYDIDENESWFSKTVSGQTSSYPIISVSEDNLDFGVATIGNEKQLNLIIKNIGTERLEIWSITTNSSNEFHTVFGFPIKISPGDSVVQSIFFEPYGSGTFYDTLLIHSNADNMEFYNVTLEGKGEYGADPSISVSTNMVDFGQITVGYEKEYLLGIKNTGEQTLTIFNAQVETDEFYTKLAIELSILPNDSTELPIFFKPNELGNFSDTLTINSNANQEPQLKVSLEGTGAYPEAPTILSIEDVPNDQGGFVRIEFQKSRYEGVEGDSSILTYSFWRKIPDSDEWDAVGLFNVIQQPIYYYVAPTLGDSTKDGIFWSTFKVSAHPSDPLMYFMSEPDSGYSVDNIAPEAPTNLIATTTYQGLEVFLNWDKNIEDDLSYYTIYRSHDEGFTPDSSNLLTMITDTTYSDSEILNGQYYYKISATDYSGNESEYSDESSVIVGIDEIIALPTEYSLEQNYPNPFNPSTTIKYGLPTESNVKISIYSLLGEEIKILFNGLQKPGFHNLEFDASNLSSGIYLYRISASSLETRKEFQNVKKMVLVK